MSGVVLVVGIRLREYLQRHSEAVKLLIEGG